MVYARNEWQLCVFYALAGASFSSSLLSAAAAGSVPAAAFLAGFFFLFFFLVTSERFRRLYTYTQNVKIKHMLKLFALCVLKETKLTLIASSVMEFSVW